MAIQPPIPVLKFASDPGLLGLSLYPEQQRVLSNFWEGDYNLGLLVLGRRSGKTLLSAVCACYVATILSDEYRKHLRQNEHWYCLAIATNLEQSKLFLNVVKDMLQNSPILNPLIVRSNQEQIELKNGCIFRCLPSSARGSRGMAVGFLALDEVAHFQDNDGGNTSGKEIYQALSPSLAQFGRLGRVLLTSSPWVSSGLFHTFYDKANRGELPNAYVANAPSWVMNPTLSEAFIEEQKAILGPQAFSAEYGAEFVTDLSAFLDGHLIDASINRDRQVLPPELQFKGQYFCSLDPSKGGVGRDTYTAAIGHLEGDRLVVDLFHEFAASFQDGKRRQVAVEEVESWILLQHKVYGFRQVILDQFNSASTIQRLSSKLNIRELTWTSNSKVQAYTRLRELFASYKIELYPHAQAINQLRKLAVVYRPGGWTVTGGSSASVDDYCAALAGLVLFARNSLRREPIPQAVSYNLGGSLVSEHRRESPYEAWQKSRK